MKVEQAFWCDSCDSAAESEWRVVDPETGRPCYCCRSCGFYLWRQGWTSEPVYMLPGPGRESAPSLAELLAPYVVGGARRG